MSTLYPHHRITPDAIHAAATLNNFATVAPVNARVLELGCGTAERLINYAAACPQTVTIGIDIDESAIVQGQQHAASLGCQNIELFAAGLGDLLAVDPGEFDYIIIHGAFAHVGKAEREALLKWCQTHLSAHGIVATRWSVLPGDGFRSSLRQALQFHLERAEEGADLLASARAMLSFLLVALKDGEFRNLVLAAEQMDDLTFTLTWLNQEETASTLTDFNSLTEDAGLQYLGDLMPQYELGGYYGSATSQTLSAVSVGLNRVASQQYLDYAVQRGQRFSLLRQRQATVTPAMPDLLQLQNLHWAGNFVQLRNDKGKESRAFTNGQGETVFTDNRISIRLMHLLGSAWPMSLSFEQLVFNCRDPESHDDIRDKVWESLQALFMKCSNGLYWSASPGAYNAAQNDVLEPVVALPAERPESNVSLVNLWGESVLLTPDEWDYLHEGMPVTDTSSWQCYQGLKTKALLSGTPTAWKTQVQRFLRAGHVETLKSQLSLLLLLSVNQQRGGLLRDETQEPVFNDPQNNVDAIYDRVNTLIKEGKSKEAREYASGLMDSDPENMHVLRCYSRACILTSAWDDALLALCKLMGHYFSSLDIYHDLATVLQKKREFYHARTITRALLRLDNNNINFWFNLAMIHHACGDMTLAEKCCRETLRFQQLDARYLGITGVILSDNQKMEEARYFLEKAVELSNYNFDYFTSLLFAMTHDPTVTPQQLLEKHLEYGERVAQWAKSRDVQLPLNNVKDPLRKLRVGFVSGDLRTHPVANFLLPFWDGLDRERYDLVAYSTAFINTDPVTEHLRATALFWRDVDTLGSVEMAKMINDDKIDILFDLSGHTTYNRLPVFALRPAPVQISWIGYPGTTGLAEMDYRLLSSTLAKSTGLQAQLTERIMYTETRKLFEPHPKSPDVNTLPALRNGYLTFGSFNRPKKINDNVIKVWAEILKQYPESRLLLGFMTDDEMIASMKKRFLKLGIQADRLLFRGLVDLEVYLGFHHDVDILLDAFPYTGGTTTNHGAWMGVPTLTLSGETVAGQQGVDIMRSFGLDEFVVTDEQRYIETALYWRDHFAELNAIRQSMRGRIPTENDKDFNVAATFDRALREAWGLYCRGEAPRSMLVEEHAVSFL